MFWLLSQRLSPSVDLFEAYLTHLQINNIKRVKCTTLNAKNLSFLCQNDTCIVKYIMLQITMKIILFFFFQTFKSYRIRPYYRPCPHNRPPDFYFIFTYHGPLDDLFPDVLLYFHLLSPT